MEPTATCPACGQGIFHDDAFCSSCGSEAGADGGARSAARRALIQRTVPTADRQNCASCNSLLLPGDSFCSKCGARRDVAMESGFRYSAGSISTLITQSSQGKYECIRELGQGGMGIVFLALDRELERTVAIKALSPSWLSDEAMVKRFRREARTIARFRHESIITIYDEGRAGELTFFVMDYIEGVPLSQILRHHGPLSIPVVEAILYRVGSGLDYAHRPGHEIVHRDVKPSNIMIDTDGLAILMDFGISRDVQSTAELTRTGMVIGTPEYMSPEQCRGHTVTPASDQYSLGAVVYAMLTGAPPFTGPFYQVLMAHGNEAVPSIREARPDCPPELAALVERMLAKHPGERWPTIRHALNAIRLRPLPHGDPVLAELAGLVRDCQKRERPTRLGSPDFEDSRTPTSIRIIPHPGVIEIGDHVSLMAEALFPEGSRELWRKVRWDSTDPSIARVDPSSGELVAVGEGSVVITAVGSGLESSVAVEVKPSQVTELEISPSFLEVEVGSRTQFCAEPRNKRGDTLDRPVEWSSSSPRIATITPDGVLVAHRDGFVTVLAYCDGVGAASEVRVTSTSLPHDDATTRTRTWRGDQLTAPRTAGTVAGAGSSPARSNRKWLFVVGLMAVMIGASIWMGRVLIPTGPVGGISELRLLIDGRPVEGDGIDMIVGDTITLSVMIQETGGLERDGRVTWTTLDPSIATFGPEGLLVAVGQGVTEIAAVADTVRRAITLTVDPSRADVVLTLAGGDRLEEPMEISVGQTVELVANVLDKRGQRAADQHVVWHSSQPTRAPVDGTGRVTARAPGAVVITATAGGVTRQAEVVVVRPEEPAVPAGRPRPPADGRLVLRIWPYAHITINNESHGAESVLDLPLPPGRHRVRLEHPMMSPLDTVITVVPGETAELNIRMRERTDE